MNVLVKEFEKKRDSRPRPGGIVGNFGVSPAAPVDQAAASTPGEIENLRAGLTMIYKELAELRVASTANNNSGGQIATVQQGPPAQASGETAPPTSRQDDRGRERRRNDDRNLRDSGGRSWGRDDGYGRGQRPDDRRCNNCNRRGHIARDCREPPRNQYGPPRNNYDRYDRNYDRNYGRNYDRNYGRDQQNRYPPAYNDGYQQPPPYYNQQQYNRPPPRQQRRSNDRAPPNWGRQPTMEWGPSNQGQRPPQQQPLGQQEQNMYQADEGFYDQDPN